MKVDFQSCTSADAAGMPRRRYSGASFAYNAPPARDVQLNPCDLVTYFVYLILC